MTPLEKAEAAVTKAEEPLLRRLAMSFGSYDAARDLQLVDDLIRAVEARYDARLRETANSPNLSDSGRALSHFLAGAVAGWPTGSRARFGDTEGPNWEETT